MKKIALLLPLLLVAKFASADVSTTDETITKNIGADAASQITFDPGRATLTDAEITALNDLVNQARANNEKIDSVKVFVWGDKVYSETAGNAASAKEKKVADDRVANIKRYLQKDLKVRDVETFNMTRQPRAFSDLVNASGSKVQGLKQAPATASNTTTTTTTPDGETTTATAPAAPQSNADLAQFAKGSPSEALVLVYKK